MPASALQHSPIWRCNILQKYFAIFSKKYLQKTYRDVPGESDTGIDGFIEFVDTEDVTGQMIAVQVKTGSSYYNKSKEQFELKIEKDMLDYWKNYMLPVVLFFY